jgi:hypothetical protein
MASGLATGFLDFMRHGFELFALAIEQRDPGAFAGEAYRRCSPDARRGPSDERSLAIEPVADHGPFPFLSMEHVAAGQAGRRRRCWRGPQPTDSAARSAVPLASSSAS